MRPGSREILLTGAAPGFFIAVAASGILGSQYAPIAGNYRAALVLWVLAIALWALPI